MPTKREREYYREGYADGIRYVLESEALAKRREPRRTALAHTEAYEDILYKETHPKRKRKLSAWNKYVKANSKKPRFRYRNGKLNLKKMAIAFRKTPQGRKKRR